MVIVQEAVKSQNILLKSTRDPDFVVWLLQAINAIQYFSQSCTSSVEKPSRKIQLPYKVPL